MDYRVYGTIYALLFFAWMLQPFRLDWFDRTAPAILGLAGLTALVQFLEWLWS
jgi:hypothetical protein